MKGRIWYILMAALIIGTSFAMPGMMGGPRGGDMDSASSEGTSEAVVAMAGGGGGLPLLEVGIGLAILAALIWWFDLRKKAGDNIGK